MFDFKDYKMVSRSVQTNVLELLGVDDIMPLNKEWMRKKEL